MKDKEHAAKCKVAQQLLSADPQLRNTDLNTALAKQFGKGLWPDSIAACRKALGIRKMGRSAKVVAAGQPSIDAPVPRKPLPVAVMVVPDAQPHPMAAVYGKVIAHMKRSGVESVTFKNDGSVRIVRTTEEFFQL